MSRQTDKDNTRFTSSQQVLIAFALFSAAASTAVCAPMGGAGAQRVFETKAHWVYWVFFSLSPILYLMLSGRACSLAALKINTLKREEITVKSVAQFSGLMVLGAWSGAINATNSLEYLPRPLWFCFPFALMVPGVVNLSGIRAYIKRCHLLIARCLFAMKRSEVSDRPPSYSRHPLVYVFSALGLVTGVLAEIYTYPMAKRIGEHLAPPIAKVFGPLFAIVCIILRAGMCGFASSDVMMSSVDGLITAIQRRRLPGDWKTNMIRVGIAMLSVAAAFPSAENQIREMGKEGFWGQVFTLSALLAPCYLTYWAGDQVFGLYLQWRGHQQQQASLHEGLPLIQVPERDGVPMQLQLI